MKFHPTIKGVTVFESEKEMLMDLIGRAILINAEYELLSEIWMNENGMLMSHFQPAISFNYNVIKDYKNYTIKG